MAPTRPDPNSSPPENLVNAYLHSLTITNPNLTLDAISRTLSVRPAPNQQSTVSVISGSALTSSPYIASFVGPGLLTACIGKSFIVPFDPVEHVRIAIQERVLTTQKVLFIVPQYGDDKSILQDVAFSAKCKDPKMQFELLTAPNTLQLGPDPELEHRPGAGLPLLLKICSATAAAGYSLKEVLRVGKLVVKNLISVGSNLRPDLHDGTESRPSEPDMSLRVRHMILGMLHPKLRSPDFVQVNSNEVVLHVSGHSGLTVLELGAITAEVVKQMEHWNVRPVRIYTESVSESSLLGRQGIHSKDFAITILNVCNTDIGGPSMIQLLDAPVEAVGWTAFVKGRSWEAKTTRLWERNVQWVRPSGLKCNPEMIWRGVTTGSRAVVAFAKRNKLAGGYPYESWYGNAEAAAGQNSQAEDVWKSAKGAIEALALLQSLSHDMVILMNDVMSAIVPALDNPFGALVTVFCIALTQSFRKQSVTADEVNLGMWIYALEDAFQELSQCANHRQAMAPMLNALHTFVQTMHSTGDLSKAAKAAQQNPDTATDLAAQLLCAFFAGLAGRVSGDQEQGSDMDKEAGAREKRQEGQPGKEVRFEAESSSDAIAGEGLQAEVLDQSLQEEGSPTYMTEKMDQPTTSADEKHLAHVVMGPQTMANQDSSVAHLVSTPEFMEPWVTGITYGGQMVENGAIQGPHTATGGNQASDTATVSLGSQEPSIKEPASPTGVIASLGAALGLTSKEAKPKEETATTQPAPTHEGQVSETSRDAVVDEPHIKHSEFDAAMEGTRSRDRVPLPTRQMKEISLLDMVQQQIETLGMSSKEGAAAKKDTDEEEYEFV